MKLFKPSKNIIKQPIRITSSPTPSTIDQDLESALLEIEIITLYMQDLDLDSNEEYKEKANCTLFRKYYPNFPKKFVDLEFIDEVDQKKIISNPEKKTANPVPDSILEQQKQLSYENRSCSLYADSPTIKRKASSKMKKVHRSFSLPTSTNFSSELLLISQAGLDNPTLVNVEVQHEVASGSGVPERVSSLGIFKTL